MVAQQLPVHMSWPCCAGGKAGRTYRALKFGSCKPQQGAATVSNPDDIQAGKVVVRLRQVQDTGATKQPSIIQAGPGSAATSKKLPEGKKVNCALHPLS